MQRVKHGHSRWIVESSILAMVLIGLVAGKTAMICLFAAVLKISQLC